MFIYNKVEDLLFINLVILIVFVFTILLILATTTKKKIIRNDIIFSLVFGFVLSLLSLTVRNYTGGMFVDSLGWPGKMMNVVHESGVSGVFRFSEIVEVGFVFHKIVANILFYSGIFLIFRILFSKKKIK